MIKKPLKKPLRIQVKEALLRRLPLHHEKRAEITANLQKRWSGYVGEQQLDYHLSFLNEQEFDIFHDLRLVVNKKICQLDTLVVTPQVLFIIESKNFAGELLYDHEIKRFIRKYQDQESSFPDPIMQVNRQKHILKEWLGSTKLSMPIEGLVSIGNSTLMLKTNGPREIFSKILYAEQIPQQVQLTKEKYTDRLLSSYMLQKLQKRLIQAHAAPELNLLSQYRIDPTDIITGVQCPSCKNIPLIRIKYHWYCPACQQVSKDAHNQAIEDYFLIYGQATNKQCRKFLHITSINLCSRWLNDLEFPYTGSGRYKVYYRKNS